MNQNNYNAMDAFQRELILVLTRIAGALEELAKNVKAEV